MQPQSPAWLIHYRTTRRKLPAFAQCICFPSMLITVYASHNPLLTAYASHNPLLTAYAFFHPLPTVCAFHNPLLIADASIILWSLYIISFILHRVCFPSYFAHCACIPSSLAYVSNHTHCNRVWRRDSAHWLTELAPPISHTPSLLPAFFPSLSVICSGFLFIPPGMWTGAMWAYCSPVQKRIYRPQPPFLYLRHLIQLSMSLCWAVCEAVDRERSGMGMAFGHLVIYPAFFCAR